MDEIKYIDRISKREIIERVPANNFMHWLYNSPFGKLTLYTIIKRKLISTICGWLMNTKFSKKRIKKFILEYNIEINDYEEKDISKYNHFNHFFYRKIDPSKRPIGENLISPADGKILAFQEIEKSKSFFIKGSMFNLQTFLISKELSLKYQNGSMAIIRLAPSNYHRYHFPAKGIPSKTSTIKGYYYSVSPVALKKNLRIFCENKRAISTLKTDNYGDILISEIGATMVGSIIQSYQPNSQVEACSEKGYFAFGGSTIILLFEKGKIHFSKDILKNTENGFETGVLMGETIGE